MSFLYPSFLFGLAAIAIPIAIHLFNFRRTRKVYFTNVAFLKEVKTTTNSFRRLKQLLILAARILFLTFLVLAFAQPFISGRNPQAAATSGQGITSIYLDNSLSMQNESGKRRYLDIATGQAEELLKTLPDAPSYHLLTNDFESRDQQLVSRDKLRDRLTEVDFSDTYRPLETVYRRQQSLLERLSRTSGNQLFWISDFQKSTSGELEKLKTDTLSQIYLVPVQAEEVANVFVDSVWLATPFVKERETNQLNVRLVNTGRDRLEGLPIKLFIDEKQVSSSSVSIEPSGTGVTSFNFIVNDRGLKRCRLSFEEYPVTFDNEYYFVINASPVVNIVHLKGSGNGRFVAGVYGNESVFNTRSLSALNTDLSQSNVADLVVLDGLNSVDGSVATQLNDFVRKGGSVMIFPSVNAEIDSYSRLLNNLGVRNVQKAAAGPPVTAVANPSDQTSPATTLAPPDTKNPFFEGMFENSLHKGILAMPTAQPVLQWVNRSGMLLQFRNGQPFLSRFEAGRGRVYLCASPLELNYTSFPRHALFVPVMYKIAALSKAQERLAYSFQESSIAVEVDGAGNEPVYKLKKGDFEVIPAQRLSGNRLIFDLPENPQTATRSLAEAGYYQLTLNNGTEEKLLAFNYDRRESQLANWSPEELRRVFSTQKNVKVYDSVEKADFVKEFKSETAGVNLWKYCLLAALFFLLAEIAIIRLVKG